MLAIRLVRSGLGLSSRWPPILFKVIQETLPNANSNTSSTWTRYDRAAAAAAVGL